MCVDEPGSAQDGAKPDADDYWHDQMRKEALWGNLMAGGAGVEWYFGYKLPHSDMTCEDWRSRDHLWDLTRYALEFFQNHLPFHQMEHHDDLTSPTDDFCFALPGEVYAVYPLEGGTTVLELENYKGTFQIDWYNPREGGALPRGTISTITGPGKQSLGNPPSLPDRDWVVLVRHK